MCQIYSFQNLNGGTLEKSPCIGFVLSLIKVKKLALSLVQLLIFADTHNILYMSLYISTAAAAGGTNKMIDNIFHQDPHSLFLDNVIYGLLT